MRDARLLNGEDEGKITKELMSGGLNSFLSERVAFVGCVSTHLTLSDAIEQASFAWLLNGAG